MKRREVKKGLRVVVTHHSSINRGQVAGLTTGRVDAWGYVQIKFLITGLSRLMHISSLSVHKAPEKRPEPLSAGEIVVGTHLRYKGGLALSGRRKGDVYVVTEVEYYCCPGKDRVWHKYKSGARPNQTWEKGCLVRDSVLKYWEIIV